ncbi:hypothetical protein [Citricoccus nitrophenolicus]|uniref:hypothetical protein n=1 Tax=Citricoccus nitrophenolicus TaxID=863575 RepID=UPI0031E5729C
MNEKVELLEGYLNNVRVKGINGGSEVSVRLPSSDISNALFSPSDEVRTLSAALTYAGNWDLLTGQEIETWFHIPTLNSEDIQIISEQKEVANNALLMADRAIDQGKWRPLLGRPDRFYVMDAVRFHVELISIAVEFNGGGVSPAAVMAVDAALAANYLSNAGYTRMTYKQIAEASLTSSRIAARSLKALSTVGLWATVTPIGAETSRHYPLFVDKSRDQLKEIVV